MKWGAHIQDALTAQRRTDELRMRSAVWNAYLDHRRAERLARQYERVKDLDEQGLDSSQEQIRLMVMANQPPVQIGLLALDGLSLALDTETSTAQLRNRLESLDMLYLDPKTKEPFRWDGERFVHHVEITFDHITLVCWGHKHRQLIDPLQLRTLRIAPMCTYFVEPGVICGNPIWAVEHKGEPTRYVGKPPHTNWERWADCIPEKNPPPPPKMIRFEDTDLARDARMAKEAAMDATGLSQCGDDPRTTGHVELITIADRLVTEVLNGERGAAAALAEEYRALRIAATSEAGRRAP